MSVIHHQALIIENDTLILRGPYESGLLRLEK